MNNYIVWIVIIVIIIVGIALYMMGGAPTTEIPPTTLSDETEPNSQVAPQSLKDLLAFGTTQKCDFSGEESKGTMYTANGKGRGDFESTVEGKVEKGHMIVDSAMMHIWIEGQAQGVKIALDTSGKGQGVDINEKIDYSCESWTQDSSKFTLPAGVTFMDLGTVAPQ